MAARFIRVAIGFCCCLAMGAQSAAPQAGALAGLVLDGGSGQPIRRAIVTLSTTEASPRVAVAWTDDSGRFAFGYLPAGRYEMSVGKMGYQPAAYGAESPRRPPGVITLAAGEIRSDLVFRLQVVSTISGTVTDEDGDPLPQVQITALRPGWQRGKRQLLRGAGATTDSAGRYRLTIPAPGSYAIEAWKPFGGTIAMRAEVSAGETPQQYSYVAQYYPGTDRAESASPVTVEAGQEYPDIDFHLRAQPEVPVQGKVVLPQGAASPNPPQVNVMAVSRDAGNQTRMGAMYFPDQGFRFGSLPPGAYSIVATATIDGRAYRGVQEVDAVGEGMRDLAIALEPGIDLSGSISAEGPAAAKILPPSVNLVPGDGLPMNGLPPSAKVAKDGSFTITGVPPGIWDINTGALAPGAYIKSMRLGDDDVLTEEMEIRSNSRASLKIVIGSPAATVQGDVTRDGQPARSMVLLAPESRLRHVLSLYKSVAANTAGHFEIKNVTPGTYQLFAFDEFDRQSIQDPEFLKPFEQEGVTVTLKEGENPPQKLSTVLAANPQAARAPGGTQ